MWYVCDVLYAVLYAHVRCFVVRGCAVSRRYIDVCNCMCLEWGMRYRGEWIGIVGTEGVWDVCLCLCCGGAGGIGGGGVVSWLV